MRWIEVSVETKSEDIDARCAEMATFGASGFVIENEEDFRDFLENNHQYWDYVDAELEEKYAGISRIKCYLADDEDGSAVLSRIRSAYGEVQTAFVDDSDWENSWKDSYQPIEVGSKLVVVPEWDEVPDNGRVPLILEPGLTFGTGSHPTTRMCLAALEDYAGEGVRVLDLGCGSGILGIGALVLGSRESMGCDIDTKSPDIAAYNASLNGLGPDRFRVCAGDIISDAGVRRYLGTGYDLVLANIVSDVIIALAKYVRGFMAKGAAFICSGIIDGREDEVRSVLEANGFTVLKHLNEEEWHCFVCA